MVAILDKNSCRPNKNYILKQNLTPWDRDDLETLIVAQLVKKFFVFHGIRSI
jgi:hypothetical protein